MDNFLEASVRPKLDMGHIEDQIKSEKKQSLSSHVQTSLKQEILQLEKGLKDQVAVRHSLERALGYTSSSPDFANDDVSLPKPATEIINEISVLELEVMHLEQYLLSLYRKAFDQQVTTLSPPSKDETSKLPLSTPRSRRLQFSKSDITPRREVLTPQPTIPSVNPYHESDNMRDDEKMADSVVQRCHSNISQYSVSAEKPPQVESLGKALRACHSQPLSMMEYAQNTSSNVISLADHLGTRISDLIPETSNKISEDMIRCMSSIYYKLIDPSKENHALSSPISSLLSMSAFSQKVQCDMYLSSFDVKSDNSFHAEGIKEISGPYSTMFEVSCIYRDNQDLADIEDMLMNFRSLIGRLEQVDPRKMTHEEKLAFWINIHNALMMHGFLAYGIPQNNVKRVNLLFKAAYNVGGHIISADTIQNLILGCRMSRPGQWLRLLLSPKSRFKSINERQAYSIDHPEPLLHFALCSGSHSDPALLQICNQSLLDNLSRCFVNKIGIVRVMQVRVYTPKSVYQELEIAKEEYICATLSIIKDKKLHLPKIVESFAKESGLCPNGLTEMIQQYLPEYVRKSFKKYQPGKPEKSIAWIPYNFSFRYLISKELVT